MRSWSRYENHERTLSRPPRHCSAPFGLSHQRRRLGGQATLFSNCGWRAFPGGLQHWAFVRVLTEGPSGLPAGGWPPPWGIAYRVDHLNGLVLAVVSIAALLNLIASKKSVEAGVPRKARAFLYPLCSAGHRTPGHRRHRRCLQPLRAPGDRSPYRLCPHCHGRGRAPLAALNYVFMGTIGACFYLLGVGYLYIVTGSLNMADIAPFCPLSTTPRPWSWPLSSAWSGCGSRWPSFRCIPGCPTRTPMRPLRSAAWSRPW